MTPALPAWIPAMMSCNGAWDEVIRHLFAVFDRDFCRGRPRFRGSMLTWDTRRLEGSYEEGFWHLITREERRSGERQADFRRAERLPWCRPVIDHETDSAVAAWDYDHGRKNVRTYLWLRDHDYVIVMQRRENKKGFVSFVLVTAYHVDGPRSRRKLEASFANRMA